jgi:hypothetical protein
MLHVAQSTFVVSVHNHNMLFHTFCRASVSSLCVSGSPIALLWLGLELEFETYELNN